MSFENASVLSSSFLTRLSMEMIRCTNGSLMCRPSVRALSSTLPMVSRMPVEPTGTVATLLMARIASTASVTQAIISFLIIASLLPGR